MREEHLERKEKSVLAQQKRARAKMQAAAQPLPRAQPPTLSASQVAYDNSFNEFMSKVGDASFRPSEC